MSDELIQPEKKVGIGAYISLIFACVFFSGAFASNHWWGIFDFESEKVSAWELSGVRVLRSQNTLTGRT